MEPVLNSRFDLFNFISKIKCSNLAVYALNDTTWGSLFEISENEFDYV